MTRLWSHYDPNMPPRRRGKYHPPNVDRLPNAAVKVDSQVQQRLELAWLGLTGFTVSHLDQKKKSMQIGANDYDGKKGEPPTIDSQPVDQNEVLQQVYGFVAYYADRDLEGPGLFLVKFLYLDEEGEQRYRSAEFEFTPSGYEEDDDEVEVDPAASEFLSSALDQAKPVVDAIVRPMLDNVTDREKALTKRENEFLAMRNKHLEDVVGEYKGIITIQSDAIKQRDEHVKSADERMFKVNKALVGGREAELEARREAQQAFTSGIQMKMQAIDQIQEMNNEHYVGEIERIRKDKRHSERVDFIKQFGPAAVAFLPTLLQNVTAAIAKGRQGAVADPAAIPDMGSAGMMPTAAAPPGAPPVPLATTPSPTPSHAPSPPVVQQHSECATSLRKFHSMFNEATWGALRDKFGVDSPHMISLQSFADVSSDLDVVGLIHRFYTTFTDEEMTFFTQHVSEDQSVHMQYVLDRINTLQSSVGPVQPQAAPQAPASEDSPLTEATPPGDA